MISQNLQGALIYFGLLMATFSAFDIAQREKKKWFMWITFLGMIAFFTAFIYEAFFAIKGLF